MIRFSFFLCSVALLVHATPVVEEAEVDNLPVEAEFELPIGDALSSMLDNVFNFAGLMTDDTESSSDEVQVSVEEPDFIGDTVSSIVDAFFSDSGLMTDNTEKKASSSMSSSTSTYYLNSEDDFPITVISMSSSDPVSLPGNLGGILDGLFGGLLNNNIGSMLRGPRFDTEEMVVPVTLLNDKPTQNDEEVTELKQQMQAMEEHIGDLESLRTVSELGFAEANWGVNADLLRQTCMPSFQTLCPESVPEVFFQALHQFPPPGVAHGGLAPEDPDAPCWMKCIDVHKAQLPYECVETANRMTIWLAAHDSEGLTDPNMMILGAFLHFLVMVLLISVCIRCTLVCLRMRRQRRRQTTTEAVKSVRPITIQIPSLQHVFDNGDDVMEATVVTGVEVTMLK